MQCFLWQLKAFLKCLIELLIHIFRLLLKTAKTSYEQKSIKFINNDHSKQNQLSAMREKISNTKIIKFFKKNYQSTSFIDGLKIKYRTLICPFAELLNYIPPNAKIADISCGSGQFLLLASEFRKPAQVFGIEISKRLVDNANNLFSNYGKQNYHFEVYHDMNFPEELREMDLIFLIDVLHHVPKGLQEEFLRKLADMLKPGAKLILKDIEAGSPLVFFNKTHDFIFAGEIGNELKHSKTRMLLEQNHLKIINYTKRTMYVYPHYTLVAQKPVR